MSGLTRNALRLLRWADNISEAGWYSVPALVADHEFRIKVTALLNDACRLVTEEAKREIRDAREDDI